MAQLITAPSRWAVTAAVALPTYMSGRVAIIGDAVSLMHSTTTTDAYFIVASRRMGCLLIKPLEAAKASK